MSSSCQRVITTITLAPLCKRVDKVVSHSSHILFRIVSLCASALFLIGSSIIIKSAPSPVILPPIPVATIPPALSPTLQFVAVLLSFAICMLNISLPNSTNLLRLSLPNLRAKPSLYAVAITRLFGLRPMKYEGNVSVIVIDLL